MALKRLGTTATTSLNAMQAGKSGGATGVQNQTNIAILNNHIANDLVNGLPVITGSFFGSGGGGLTAAGTPTSEGAGTLYIPNRGVLKVLWGDVVAYDSQGWPILVSQYSISNGPWNFA